VLDRPLDVVIVRKIGHPFQREFAVGALAEGGVVVLDEKVLGTDAMVHAELGRVIEEERERLITYQGRFPHPELSGMAAKSVLVVDDGLATGATTEAAVRSALQRGASRVTVSAPVASSHAVERLRRVAHAVEVMIVDAGFEAVGRYYKVFPQTTDEEVLEVLAPTDQRH
jgi:predicted phosphoribosyltransferase